MIFHSHVHARILFGFLFLAVAIAPSAIAQSATVDTSFNAVPARPLNVSPSHLVQPDGKVILYGTKTVIDGVASGYFARLNSDGSRDPSFFYCDCALSNVINARVL